MTKTYTAAELAAINEAQWDAWAEGEAEAYKSMVSHGVGVMRGPTFGLDQAVRDTPRAEKKER